MPAKNSVTRKRRTGLLVYSLAVEANPGATQDTICQWVKTDGNRERWLREYNWKPPGDDQAREYIREIQRAKREDWLDDPWHTGIFAAHNDPERQIEADALPDVMAVALRVFAGGKRLTARQAGWVARLRHVLDPILSGDDDAVQDAYSLAVAYSARELAAAALAGPDADRCIPVGHESDTWGLDFTLACTLPGVGLAWSAYDAAIEAGLLLEPDWPGGARIATRTETPEVALLSRLLLRVGPPLLITDWRYMASALLRLRARIEGGVEWVTEVFPRPANTFPMARTGAKSWDSLTDTERQDEAKAIGLEVMAEMDAAKEHRNDKT